MADSSIFTAWLQAHDAGDRELETLLEKRFSPDYGAAFEAWRGTDPFYGPERTARARVHARLREPLDDQGGNA